MVLVLGCEVSFVEDLCVDLCSQSKLIARDRRNASLLPSTEPDSDASTEVEGKSAVTGADEDFERKLVFTEVHPS